MPVATSNEYYFPDILATWPWQREINPDMESVREENLEWVRSFELFEPKTYKKFEACDFGLLGSLVGPISGKGAVRASCDIMSFYYAFDEYTDMATKEEALRLSIDITEVFRNIKTAPIQETKIVEMARQFFSRATEALGDDPVAVKRFITEFDVYTKSMAVEAEDRAEKRIRGVDDYIQLRRDTTGAIGTFFFYAIGMHLPDEVYDHPTFQSLTEAASDLISLTNDIHSYPLEQSRGIAFHNILTAIMHDYHIDLQNALYFLAGYVNRIIAKFISDVKNLPSWGPETDAKVARYVEMVATTVRGYDDWMYATSRYHGPDGLSLKESRVLTMQQPLAEAYCSRQQFEASGSGLN